MPQVNNPLPPPIYYELAGSVSRLWSASATWENWDLSATLPAGTMYADIYMRILDTGTSNAGAREDGSALSRWVLRCGTESGVHIMCKVPATRIIEVYATTNALANSRAYLMGYWL